MLSDVAGALGPFRQTAVTVIAVNVMAYSRVGACVRVLASVCVCRFGRA